MTFDEIFATRVDIGLPPEGSDFPGDYAEQIRLTLKNIYTGSSLASAVVNDWLDSHHGQNIQILYVKNDISVDPAVGGSGVIHFDPSALANDYYISKTGNIVASSMRAVLAHELYHAVTGIEDRDSFANLQGDSIPTINSWYTQLNIDHRASYNSGGDYRQLDLNKQYTDGQEVFNTIVDRRVMLKSNGNPQSEVYDNTTGFIFDTGYLDLKQSGVVGSALLIGSNFSNYYVGTGSQDWIYGNGGSDRLEGGEGADKVYGGADNDKIVANFDAVGDVYDGGDGVDTIIYKYDYGNSQIVINSSQTFDIDFSGVQSNGHSMTGLDILDSIEHVAVEAGSGADGLGIAKDGIGVNVSVIDYVDFGGQGVGEYDTISFNSWTKDVNVDLSKDDASWVNKGAVPWLDVTQHLTIKNAEAAIGGEGNDRLQGGAAEGATYVLIGHDGNDVLIGGKGINHLLGGAGVDTLIAAGKYTYMTGGADHDNFLVGSNAHYKILDPEVGELAGTPQARGDGPSVEAGDDTGDEIYSAGIRLYGGLNQWWQESGYAYWAPFSALTTAFPVVGSELLYTASLFIDGLTTKFVRYSLSEDNTLKIDLAWGQSGAASIDNYSIDLDTGKGTAGIAVFTATRAEDNKAGAEKRLAQFVNLALYAGFGRGLQGYDPLVLDLDGDGYQLTTEANSKVWFDFNHNGFAQRTGWVGASDGFLVRDINANGQIDDVSEMFGNAAQGGFDMLAGYDDNLDGVINASDAIYAVLQVWQDLNQDGFTDEGELRSLAELGIVSISLATTIPAIGTAVGRNQIAREGSFTLTGGEVHKLADVVFDVSSVNTHYLGDTTISASAAALPQLAGFGTVKDLRVAMTQDAALEAQVAAFVANGTTDLAVLKSSAESIFCAWAGVASISATALGSHGFDTRKLAFLEKYAGTVLMPRDGTGAPLLDNIEQMEQLWADQVTRLTLRLVVQGPLASAFAEITYHADLDLLVANGPTALGDILHRVVTGLPASDHAEAAAQWAAWAPLLGALVESMVRSDANTVRSDFLFAQLVRAADGVAQPLSLSELASGLSIANIKIGTSGSETLSRTTFNDTAIYFGNGGDDQFNGGTGQDVYVFGHSIGHATITDIEGKPAGDRIRFAFLNSSNVHLERSGSDLLISVIATGETIRVVGQFADVALIGTDTVISGDRGIEDIQFADGSIWETPEIMAAVGTGTDGNDHMVGTMHSDVFIGGKGNDLLEGGDDADLYVINAGDGQDVITDIQTTPLLRTADMIVFGGGLTPDDITLSRGGPGLDDLVIGTGDGNSVTVKDQFAYGVLGYTGKFTLNTRIEAFGFKDDGANWSAHDVQQQLIAQEMSSGDDVTHGFGDDDTFEGTAGNDTLIGYDGQDSYHWGAGDGNDTIDEQARYVDVNVGLGGLSLGTAADTVVFDESVAPGDLVFSRPTSAPDLIITNTATGETLTVKNQFDSFQTGVLGPQWMNRIEWFTFADGTSWSWQDILLKVTTGGAGDDNLYGDLYADTLSGGAGNDYLSGGGYGDTYKFNLGDGQDTIEDANNFILGAGFITVDSQPDTLVLGAGITMADISFEHTGSDIKLLIGNGGDSVLLKGQDDYMQTGVFGAIAKDRIEKIQFADGTVWTWQELQQHVIEATTTSGNDTIAGFSMEDTFAASAGDDLMMGGDSSDTYQFGYGSGHDEIRDDATNIFYSNTDVVEFGVGVDPADVSLARDGNDLVISLAGSSDQLRITRQFENYIGYQWHTIEQFKFADGTVWSNVDVQNKLLVGTSGNDTITGFFTEDVLTGGAGNDILRGGDGGDTYIFNRGDGQDRIEEGVDFANLGDNDTIQFGAGIPLADLVLSRNGNDLIIGIAGSSDQITVVNQFDQFAWLTTDDVENFRFADGTVLSKDDVSALLLAGTSGDDNLVGTSGNDRLDGGAGNDTLSGGNGSDTYIFGRGYGQDTIIESVDQAIIPDDDRLIFKEGISASDLSYARDGNDLIISINGTSDSVRMVGEFAYSAWYTWNDVERFEFADGTIITKEAIRQQILSSTTTNHIVGFASDDTLEGGAGDDILEGGDGSDTYVFGRGSGHDSIVEQLEWGTSTENDTLRFKAGIAPGDVTVTRVGQDVVFTLDTGESVRVIGQFIEGYNEFLSSNDVEQVVFDDGTVWNKVEIARRSIHVSEGKDTVVGTWYDETIDGGAGEDTIQAGGGNDTLIGGLGNDQLEGGGGDDTYVYNPGDGNDVIKDENFGGNGTNRIRFGTGITPGSLRFTGNPADGSEMTISFVDAAGSLKLIGQWGATGDNAIEFLDFADGTTWNVAQIAAAFVAQEKTSGNDTIYGYNGADVIIGGGGNDTLVGGAGDDVYVFGRRDGVDTIVDIGRYTVWGNEDGGNDRIEFGANIAPSDVTISQSSPTDITLQINGTSDRLILTNAISDSRMRIEEVHFGNGTVWTIAQILAQSLLGTPGNDTLNGTTGSDIVAGGAGNDSLAGGGGDDYYRFGRGDGVDTIYDAGPNNLFGPTDGGYDTVQLGANITAANVRVVESSASDLTIQIIGTSDQLTLAGALNTPILRIEAVSFADGTYWTFTDLRARAIIPTSGDDVFYAGDLAATLLGGAGNDTLYGSNASDILSGGTGNDMLAGGGGDDTYRFGRGDGVDTIADIGPNNLFGPTDGGFDTIELGANITAADLRVIETSANDIAIQIIGTSDQLIISGTVSSGSRRIEAVKFADGTAWTYADLRERALAPTSGDDVFYAGDVPATLSGGGGNDVLYGSEGSDDLSGGTGNDTLYGGWGDDIYRFALGDGADLIFDRGPERWWGAESGGFDRVEMGAGIAPGDVDVVQADQNDIVLKIRGTSDQLTLSGAISDGTRQIEEVRFADGTVWTFADVLAKSQTGTSGSDTLYSGYTASTLVGAGGDDTLIGGTGNDVLVGGAGNDVLIGGSGDDTYRFARGDGKDVISDGATSAGGVDTVAFADGIDPSDVLVYLAGNGADLILKVAGTQDQITLQNTVSNGDWRIEQVTFTNGTTWTYADLMNRLAVSNDGNDHFVGTGGNDLMDGGAGDDILEGGRGNDILIGGTGNDVLSGNDGMDTYRFNLGDGQDQILEAGDWDTSIDTLEFGAGIDPAAVTVTQGNNGNDLILNIVGTTDQITLVNTVTHSDWRVDRVTFVDGTVWSHADLMTKSTLANTGNDTFYGSDVADTLMGGAGDDTLYGRRGNDILIGGTGNDVLVGNDGMDTYRFNLGDGQDLIMDSGDFDTSIDTLEFGAGIDPAAVTVTQSNNGNDLVLKIAGTTDQITLVNTITHSDWRVDRVTFVDGTVWSNDDLMAKSMLSNAGNDTFYGSDVADTLTGGAGDDTLYGRRGNDILIGGTGNDVLVGNDGMDTYRFNLGDGQDLIMDSGDYDTSIDTLEFGAGIDPASVTVTQANNGNDLILKIAGTTDQITLVNTITHSDWRVDRVTFVDGTVWSNADLMARSMLTNAGNDTFYGGDAWDVLTGGAGNDTLYGRQGNDILIGGTGNDILSGNSGADTYRFNLGDGQDLIMEAGDWDTSIDTLEFGAGIDPAAVIVTRASNGNDLTLKIAGTSDQITLVNTISSLDWRVDLVTFADGTVWTHADLVTKAAALPSIDYGTGGNDTINLASGFVTVDAEAGNDALSVSGNGGGRILFGAGLGSDTLGNPGSGYTRTDRLVLQGLNPADISFQRSGDQLKVTIVSTGETFTALSQFGGSGQQYGLGSIEFANGAIWDRTQIGSAAATTGNDTVLGSASNDFLNGLSGNDTIYGMAGNDTLVGGDGDDALYGDGTATVGPNLIVNGSFEQLGPNPSFQNWGVASDEMPGWTKTNSGHFNQVNSGLNGVFFATDGSYLMDLDDAGGAGSNMDIRQTIGGLTAGQKLLLSFDHMNERYSSSGYFEVYWNGGLIATIDYQGAQMRNSQFEVVALGGDNVLRFQGLGAEDGLGGHIDNVKLFATQPTSGDDILSGGAGNDILVGGTGNDDLGGGAGNDTYRFAVGDGQDRIFETIDSLDSGSGGYDRIELGAGILPGQVTVTQQNGGQDLLLDFGGGDSILLTHSPITNAAFAIEEVAFANGTVWTFADLLDRSSNAVPVFENTSVVSGSATERSGLTGSSLADVASGGLKFTDANASDTHSVQVTGVVTNGATSGLASNATLLGYLGLGAVAEPASGSPGTAAWTFSAADNAFDYLAAGETAAFTYALQVKDSHNASFDQNVTVTVTGANDAPVAAAGSTASGGVTEVAGATGSASNDSVGGSIKFADVDLSDLHSASIASVSVTGITSGLPANAVLLAWLAKGALVEQAGPTAGSLPWTFAAPDSAFDYLGAGQTATLTYVVQIADGAGGILSQNVIITATGTNDAPILASGTSAAGSLSELASTTGSNTNDTASGLIKFADADTADVHSVAIASVAATGVTAGLPANAALLAMLTTGAISEQAGATPGSVGWTFAAADKTFDYLAAGQTVTLTYAVQLSDGAGGTLSQNVTISVTGTNDVPLVAAGTTTGTIAELASVTGSAANDSASGALQFTDADTGNTHSATIVSVAAAGVTSGLPANATLLGWLAKGTIVEQAGATPGSLPWTFTAPDSAFDYLSAGQAATLTYVVQIADGAGGTLSQNVVLTINGATDAPVIAAGTTSTGAITELASVTGSTTNDTGTGILKFTDVDAADTHSAVVASVTASGVTGGLPANAALLALLTTGAVTEQVGATPGSIGWTFSAQDKTFDYLGAGQSVTLTYAVSVNDNHSGSVSQNVVVTVTGTNDAPVLAAGSTTTGAITELSATTGSTTNDTASGAIKFTDVDLSDVHTVTIASVATSGVTSGLPANAVLLAMLAAGTVTEAVGATPGSAPWTFTAQDKTFDYLGAGQTATLTYVVQIGDGKGGSFSQNVVVTATGTNDAPVVTVPGAQTARTSIATRVTGISVADADANASETVTVTTSVGTIAATATGGATVGGSASKTMTISGTLAAVNSTLATLTYTAGASAGSDTIQIVSNDGTASNTKTIAETISTTANHGPVIDASTTATGAITELASTVNSTTADTATGSIKFTDADVPDTHTATITSVTASGVTSGLPVNATLLAFLTKGTVTEQSGTTPGSFSWTFSAQDKTFDYLGAGQTATLTYVVTVTDSKSTSTTQNVVISITGTNDAPLVSTGTTTGAITERASLTGATTADTASGLVKFTDESADTHTATITAVAATGVVSGLPSNATLLSWMTKGALTEQAGATPGSLPWSFSAPDNAFDYLAAAQTATLTYTVQITDNLGAVLNQSVVVTITGSNDTPTAQAKSGFTTDNWTALTITGATLLAGVTDPDTADTFTLSSVQGATGGTVALTSGNAVFTPTVSAVGPASFTYTVSDGHSGTSTATVSITTTLHQTNGTSGADTLAGNSTKKAQIDGLAGNDTITAGGAGDTIIGGAGTDTLTGGAGIDTFVYHAGFGLDTINSFTATGTSHDVIQVDTSLFADWAHLLGATSQVGSDLVITLDAADKITLKNVTLANFTSADAAFV